jgi:hypothetical protein
MAQGSVTPVTDWRLLHQRQQHDIESTAPATKMHVHTSNVAKGTCAFFFKSLTTQDEGCTANKFLPDTEFNSQ